MRPWGLMYTDLGPTSLVPSLTFEMLATLEVELLDLHALENLDVAWGSGVEGTKAWGEMKKVPGLGLGRFFRRGPGASSLLLLTPHSYS